MDALTLQWDRKALALLRRDGLELALTRAARMAGRDAIRAAKTAAQRSVRARKRIRVSRINAAMRVTKSGAKLADLEWRLNVSGKAFRLSDFPFRQVKRGVSVAVNQGARKILRHAFVARLRSGHVGIFERRGKKRRPIDELFSTRITDVFHDAGMVPAVFARAQAEFTRTFDRVLPLEIEKLRAKG